MTVFLKHNNQWSCFKGSKAIEKAQQYAYKLLSMGIHSELYHKGCWTPVYKY